MTKKYAICEIKHEFNDFETPGIVVEELCKNLDALGLIPRAGHLIVDRENKKIIWDETGL